MARCWTSSPGELRPEDAGAGTQGARARGPAVQPPAPPSNSAKSFRQDEAAGHQKTPGGAPSTDEEVLTKLAEDFRRPRPSWNTAASRNRKAPTPIKLPKMVNPKTGRAHHGQAVAVTGRLSSNDPNLQKHSRAHREGPRIREAFITCRAKQIVSADYSQIEPVSWRTFRETRPARCLRQWARTHRATAAEVFSVRARP